MSDAMARYLETLTECEALRAGVEPEDLRKLANRAHALANELAREALEAEGRIPYGYVPVDLAGLAQCGCGKPSAHPARTEPTLLGACGRCGQRAHAGECAGVGR